MIMAPVLSRMADMPVFASISIKAFSAA
ncbi:MAG: hypothetical protein JWP16_1311, partial [Alphaproteobacteria bacterium]|nr:hypothetical protein [Alphaproteobacteria bacterium]